MPAEPSDTDDHKPSRTTIIIVSVVCGCIAVAALVCAIVFSMRTRRDRSLAGFAKREAAFDAANAASGAAAAVALASAN